MSSHRDKNWSLATCHKNLKCFSKSCFSPRENYPAVQLSHTKTFHGQGVVFSYSYTARSGYEISLQGLYSPVLTGEKREQGN